MEGGLVLEIRRIQVTVYKKLSQMLKNSVSSDQVNGSFSTTAVSKIQCTSLLVVGHLRQDCGQMIDVLGYNGVPK